MNMARRTTGPTAPAPRPGEEGIFMWWWRGL
ncbi:hypothetical protein STRAU_7709 [Streptomyces aurantiacus JA 4570]|uniref:Uncharacterized protein n=1 Tax=Streptomyces aurantiacus JA 4570 TaxID=1286094 RepID=S4ACN9_9ACTN|nr:hypothetical protein STRAU_7709 [Streptomyces aurantiacus JA 4570]